MAGMVILVCWSFLFFFIPGTANGMHTYEDDDGTIQMTDDPATIPEKFREEAVEIKDESNPTAFSNEPSGAVSESYNKVMQGLGGSTSRIKAISYYALSHPADIGASALKVAILLLASVTALVLVILGAFKFVRRKWAVAIVILISLGFFTVASYFALGIGLRKHLQETAQEQQMDESQEAMLRLLVSTGH